MGTSTNSPHYELESLEQRILLSADPVIADAAQGQEDLFADAEHEAFVEEAAAGDPEAAADDLFGGGEDFLAEGNESSDDPVEIGDGESASEHVVGHDSNGSGDSETGSASSNDDSNANGLADDFAQQEQLVEMQLAANPPPVAFSLADVNLTQAVETTLRNGLSDLNVWFDSLQALTDFASVLPFAESALGTVLDAGTLFQDRITAPLISYLDGAGTPSASGVAAALQGIAGTFGDVTISLPTPGSITGGQGSGSLGDQIEFHLQFDATRTFTTDLSFVRSAEAGFPLGIEAGTSITMTAGISADIVFGIELAEGVTGGDDFFIVFNDLTASAEIDESNLNFLFDVGFLEASVSGGNLDLSASLSLDVANDDGDVEGKVTVSELLGEAINDLVTVTPTASLDATLPLSASLTGLGLSGNASVRIMGDPLDPANLSYSFDGSSGLVSELQNFLRPTGETVLQVFRSTAAWLRDIVNFPTALGLNLPFGDTSDVRDIVNFADVLNERIDQLEGATEGELNFSNFQNLATQLASALGITVPSLNLGYQSSQNRVSYTFDFDVTLPAVMEDFGSSVSLGSLGGVTSSAQISVDAMASFEFTLIFDLDPFQTTVTGTTALPVNGQLSAPANFDLQANSDPTVYNIVIAPDLTNATSADLIIDINDALAAAGVTGVVASESGGMLVLTADGLIGAALGISATAGDPAITELGLDEMILSSDSLGANILLDDVELLASLTLAASGSLTAGFGPVGITGDFNLAGAAGVQVTVTDPMSPSQPISFDRMIAGLADIESFINVATSGSATFTVNNITPTGALGIVVGATPSVEMSASNIWDLSTATVSSSTDIDQLLDLQNFDFDNVFDAIGDLRDLLQDLSQDSFISQNIPGVNQALGAVLDLATYLDDALDYLTANSGLSDIDSVDDLITAAINAGLAAAGLPENVSVTPTFAADSLTFDLSWSVTYDEMVSLNFDIAEFFGHDNSSGGLNGIGNLIDVSSNANVHVEATAALNLSVGFDLTNPASPQFYLSDTSSATLGLEVSNVGPLSFEAAVGPLGIWISGGSITVDNGIAGPAAITVGLDPGTGGRWTPNQFSASIFDIGVVGVVDVSLPVFFPTPGTSAGTISLNISDLGNIAGTTTLSSTVDLVSAIGSVDLFSNADALSSAIDYLLGIIDGAFGSELSSVELPLVGGSLGDAIAFIQDLSNLLDGSLSNATASAIQTALFDLFEPGSGNGWLQDTVGGGNGVDINDVDLFTEDTDMDMAFDRIEYDLTLGSTLASVGANIGFDLGLPGLGLAITGANGGTPEVLIEIGWEWHLVFGISRTDGVYFGTANADELRVDFEISIPNVQLTGSLAFLELVAQDGLWDSMAVLSTANTTSFNGFITLDLMDPVGGNNRLTMDELSSGSANLGSILDLNIGAVADVNLALELGLVGGNSGAFPRLLANFELDWMFTSMTGFDGMDPEIAFRDIRVDLGGFLGGFVGDIFDQINSYLDPITPIIDFLNTPLPLGDSRIIDLISLVDSQAGAAASAALDAITTIRDIANLIDGVGPNTYIDLGDLVLTGMDDNGTSFDIRDPNADLSNFQLGGSNWMQPSTSADSQFGSMAPSFSGTQDDLSSDGGNLSLPLIDDPLSAIGLLFGQDVALIQYDLPQIGFGIDFDILLAVIPVFVVPVSIKLFGGLSVNLNLGFGYDTRGIRQFVESDFNSPELLINGFYIADWDANGNDRREVELIAELGVSASVDLYLIEIGVRGGLQGIFYLDLNDPEPDGRMHVDEILSQGLQCLFNFGGEINFFVRAFAEIGPCPFCWEPEITLVNITLLEFEIGCDTAPPALATLEGDGTLRLNVGDRASFRGSAYDDETEEDYNITPGPEPGSVTVTALGFSVDYGSTGTPITSIVGDAGSDNDEITISNAITVPTNISGGSGNDLLRGGGGVDTLNGGSGADTLEGQDGNDILNGGDDNDSIDGGTGADDIQGGGGSDTLLGAEGADDIAGYLFGSGGLSSQADVIFGGLDNDTIEGSDGDDDITGDGGEDTINGRGGDDTIRGLEGIDHIDGGSGNDLIYGGFDADILEGGSGSDIIVGGAQADTIYGHTSSSTGSDRDYLYGDYARGVTINSQQIEDYGVFTDANDVAQEANDIIRGGGGNDLIRGEGGDDDLFGQDGDDDIRGGDGEDEIEGGNGNDTIDGGSGEDDIQGGNNNDTIFGGGGVDTIHGNAGNDVIHGQGSGDFLYGDENDDNIYGNSGNDQVWGGTGNDRIFGGSGVDLLMGEAGNDTISGGTQDDTIYGDSGDDFILGNEGNDEVFGDTGNDTILGYSGIDHLYGEEDDDTIFGGADGDIIYGYSGDDTIFGQGGMDLAYGGRGMDFIDGGTEDDLLYGESGPDTVNGGDGNDSIFGGEDDDILNGNNDDDYVDGGSGIDTIHGNDGNDTLVAGSGLGTVVYGDDGDDTIFGTDEGSDDPNLNDGVYFGDRLFGGNHNDRIYGLGGADIIDAGSGDDWVDGGEHGDLILGGLGIDILLGGRGNDEIHGGGGRDQLFGDHGADTLFGEDDEDLLDGGWGTDILWGGDGDDELRGGGGSGDTLYGELGDDVLKGSNDGADNLFGGAGIDRIFGYGGNDMIDGGDGDDIIEGGDGDDTIEGGAGSDVVTGGADHDSIYGHSISGTGDDSAVDYLYGDFGTNLDELGSGQDRLFGNGGNDLLFGEAFDDLLVQGGGASGVEDYGSGDGGTPGDFTPPSGTPNPVLDSEGELAQAGADLANGGNDTSFWGELLDSASGGGVSGNGSISIESVVVAAAGGLLFVAWADGRNGNYEIYLARYNGSDWSMLGGSAEFGGISNTAGSSRNPSLVLDGAGNPVVSWTETSGSSSDIRVATYNPGTTSWDALGSSLGAGGISDTGGAGASQIVRTSAGLSVLWEDDSSGTNQVYGRSYSAPNWNVIGSASGGGISSATSDISHLDVAASGTGSINIAATWTHTVGGVDQIYLRQWNGATWASLSNSASAGGVSNTVTHSATPTVAYQGSNIFVAWVEHLSTRSQIFGERYTGSWQTAGTGSNSGAGISNTDGGVRDPQLAGNGSEIVLAYNDQSVLNRPLSAGAVSAFVSTWDGASFDEVYPGDASFAGISQQVDVIAGITAAVDPAGAIYVGWTELSGSSPEAFLVANTFVETNRFTAAGGGAIQTILDANDLGAGDVILVQSGTHSGFTISTNDAGVLIVGAGDYGSSITGNVTIDADDVIIRNLTFSGDLTVSGNQFTLTSAVVANANGIVIDGASGANIVRSSISAGEGISLRGSPTGVSIRHNDISATGGTAIDIETPTTGIIASNSLHDSSTGLHVQAVFTGLISGNEIFDNTVGVDYDAEAALAGNEIHDNTTGVSVSVNGLGDPIGSGSNEIHDNSTGVVLQGGRVTGQHIFSNVTGVSGTGIVGGDDFSTPNVIELNTTGVNVIGTVQYNRIGINDVGVQATSDQLIQHNVFYRNLTSAIAVTGTSATRIEYNTLYSFAGDNIRVTSGASETTIRNNILWSLSGFDLWVDNTSQGGFQSDYNLLFAGPAGTLVHWGNNGGVDFDFVDILDWQQDVFVHDLHSIGRTEVNPDWANPRFFSLATDDFRVYAPVAGLRLTSPSVNGADPRVDNELNVAYTNLLTNPGFEAGFAGWTTSPNPVIGTSTPDAYEGANYFTAGLTDTGFAEQTIDLLSAGVSAAAIDGFDLYAVFGGRLRSLAESLNDTGSLTLRFLDASLVEISSITVEASDLDDSWELVGDRVLIPGLTRHLVFRFDANEQTTSSNDAYLDGAFLYVLDETTGPDQGAYGLTADDSDRAEAQLNLRFPDLYVDWERAQPLDITWDSFGNVGELPVTIQLWQDTADGPAFVDTISAATSDDGEFIWIPSINNVAFDTEGLRIQISLVGNPAVLDRSQETFTVPEDSLEFYVNDRAPADANDQYTNAPGDNRNTGRNPDEPKPTINALLRIYSVGPTNTLFVDHGTYLEHNRVLLSGTVGVGDDEGFIFTGPSNAMSTATIAHARPDRVAPLVTLSDADFVTMRHFNLPDGQYGLLLTGNSTDFDGSFLTITGSTIDGILLQGTSTITSLDSLTVTGNGDHGVNINGGIASLTNSNVSSNAGMGLYLRSTGLLNIEGNTVSNNGEYGIYYQGSASIPTTIDGNIVSFNGYEGIYVTSRATVTGNTVFGHTGNNREGIYASGDISVDGNVTYNNHTGIRVRGSAEATNNRSYGNALYGLIMEDNTLASGNVSYSNTHGIYYSDTGSGVIRNNVVYDNSIYGIFVNDFSGTRTTVENNTVHVTAANGVGIRVQGTNGGAALANNIVYVDAPNGYALSVAADTQSRFVSNYNLLYAVGGSNVGLWQNANRSTLAAWQNAAFTDLNSVSQDPLFVDVDGADNTLGYVNGVTDGRDDDFHLQSTFGSYHGGSFAPVINVGTGLPEALPPTLSVDAGQSPAIDRGDPLTPFANEPVNNGNFVNLGAYGNTVQASLSPAEYVLITVPDGGAVYPADQNLTVSWRSHDFTGTVDIELLLGGAVDTLIAEDTANDGEFIWLIPEGQTPGLTYTIRVTRNAPMISDVSNADFEITAPISLYYVNDGVVNPDDLTTAIGDNGNDGLDPSRPRADIRSILDTYDLGPGDVIIVDTGEYNLTTNIFVTADDAGVTIRGYDEVAFPDRISLINRGNTGSSSFAFELQNADDIVIENLHITGGYVGIHAGTSSDSDNVSISNNRIFENYQYGIRIQTGNDFVSVTGNEFYGDRSTVTGFDNQNTGILIQGTDAFISGNEVHSSGGVGISISGARSLTADNVVHYNVSTGISVSGADSVIRSNMAFRNGGDGISASSTTLVELNTAYGHGTNRAGIYVSSSALARENVSYSNGNGIVVQNTAQAVDNRVYDNSSSGILIYQSGQVLENQIYNNGIGINISTGNYSPLIENNLVYNNVTYGIRVSHSASSAYATIRNNTVYEPVADAVRIESGSQRNTFRNNIFWVESGLVYNVDPNGQVGFSSDYNFFQLGASADLAVWSSATFTNLIDWQLEIGNDTNSSEGDALFADIDGLDDILGYSEAQIGLPIVLDDSDPGFSATAGWTVVNGSGGYGDSYTEINPSVLNQDVATWTFTGLSPGTYEVSATWLYLNGNTNNAYFATYDGDLASPLSSNRLTQNSGATPNDFVFDGASWERIFTVDITGSSLIITMSGDGSRARADGIHLQQITGDQGGDDDFSVAAGSPTIDAGDPLSYYLREPTQSGGRANLGHTGNTPQAVPSAAEVVQIVSPNGGERIEEGEIYEVQFRSFGLAQEDPVALINLYRPGANQSFENWLGNRYQTTEGSWSNFSASTPIDTSGVATGAAPEDVYRYYVTANQGNSLIWTLPVPDGSYLVRLHFVDSSDSTTSRLMDISVNGVLALDDYNIRAAAGASYTAVAEEVATTAVGDNGIEIDIFAVASSSLISGIEIVQLNPGGAATPTVDLEYSSNDGSSWSPVPGGNDLTADRYGRGSFLWTATGPETTQARMRATADQGTMPVDTSDETFFVVNNGTSFYINDHSLVDDEYSTAFGDNNNTGRSPDQPMASLAALLFAYDLEPGDIIHIDSGNYALISNVIIGSSDSGATLRGPIGGGAVLDRNNVSSTAYALQLSGVDDLTIENLTIRGAYHGIVASGAGVDRLTVHNNVLADNNERGIYLVSSNDAVITDNEVYGTIGNTSFDTSYGIFLQSGTNQLVSGNDVHDTRSTGIYVTSTNSEVSVNDVHDNSGDGIYVAGAGSMATSNTAYNNNSEGIYLGSNTVGELNTTYGNGTGIYLSSTSTARNNTSYGNGTGIYLQGNGFAENNRVYGNTGAGLRITNSGTATGNTIFGNNIGIDINASNDAILIRNNLIYGNTTSAIDVVGTSNSAIYTRIENNTIHQENGNAILVSTNSYYTDIRNNIIWVDGPGSAILVDTSSQFAFFSDYNWFYLTGVGSQFITWGAVVFTQVDEWYYEVGVGQHSTIGDPLFEDPDGADDILGYNAIDGDAGLDDDFSVRSISETIDVGDPQSYFLEEPGPNGGRVNLGHTGNTEDATLSPGQVVQVLSPNGYEHLESGQDYSIDWRVAGFLPDETLALINVGPSQSVGQWLQSRYQTQFWAQNTWSSSIDTTGVSNPAPEAVYQSYAWLNSADGQLSWSLPVPDAGDYHVRLHFAQSNPSVGNRFDVTVNGVLAADDYDIAVAAGGVGSTATVLDIPVPGVLAGEGIDIVLQSVTGFIYISGIELIRSSPTPPANGNVDLEFFSDVTGVWTPIPGAQNLAPDAQGTGRLDWTAPAETNGHTARIRAISSALPAVFDDSDNPFLIANNGTAFYVNDNSLVGDEYTTAVGNNANSGRTPDQPMASIAALLRLYDLDQGDVIFVDSGNYDLLVNILVADDDSNFRFQGPVSGGSAVLDRGNTSNRSYVMGLVRVDDVAIDRLEFTGGYYGVYLPNTGNVTDFRITNSVVQGNDLRGIFIGYGNSSPEISNNEVFGIPGGDATDDQDWGLYVDSPGALIQGNTVYDNRGHGIYIGSNGDFAVIDSNTVFSNLNTGIVVASSDSVVSNNVVYDNLDDGINASNNTLVVNNEVYGHISINDSGLYITGSVLALDNRVWGNYDGIEIRGASAESLNNRVFGNSRFGIYISNSGFANGNYVYSNQIGIYGTGSNDRMRIINNVIYDNTDHGIFVTTTATSAVNGNRLVSNTIFQDVGDAIHIDTSSSYNEVYNNILFVNVGHGIFVDAGSSTGFRSDYNLFNTSADPNAFVGHWLGANLTTLVDWQNGTPAGVDDGSTYGDPIFVDMDGADGVLGYNAVDGDGGQDDNFYVARLSPAIDAGQSWETPLTDLAGQTRLDDDGTVNTGSPSYFITDLGVSLFDPVGGTAQNWRSSNSSWTLNFGFTFNFHGVDYTSARVTSEGLIQFVSTTDLLDQTNSTEELAQYPRIAVMWDNLSTLTPGNIYLDTTTVGQMTVRWEGTNASDSSPVNYAVTLVDDGSFQFHYGSGNDNLTPTVGVSSGLGSVLLATYDGAANLDGANSLGFTTAPGFVDVGAYEFGGSSNDLIPATIVGTDPAIVHTEGTSDVAIFNIRVDFSEPVNPVDANAPANYELRNWGNNMTFGDVDDTVYIIDPDYNAGDLFVILQIVDGPLPAGEYQLILSGNTSIHDLAGIRIDGDENGSEGGDYVRRFTVQTEAIPPRITEVIVANSEWDQAYRAALDPGREIGYSIPLGDSDQLIPLALDGIDQISISFNEHISYDLTHLDIGSLLGTSVFVDSWSYNTADFMLTIILADPLLNDRYEFVVADTLTDFWGNALDGEWTNASSSLSGNGVAGGDFRFAFNIQAGDVNADGVTNDLDLLLIWQQSGGAYDPLLDLNGDGVHNNGDIDVVRNNYLQALQAPGAFTSSLIVPVPPPTPSVINDPFAPGGAPLIKPQIEPQIEKLAGPTKFKMLNALQEKIAAEVQVEPDEEDDAAGIADPAVEPQEIPGAGLAAQWFKLARQVIDLDEEPGENGDQ